MTLPLPPIEKERLANGASVVVARKAGVPLVAVRLVVRAGAALDPPGRFGLAHLVAGTSRRGTRRRSGKQMDDEVESLGAELATGCDDDATYVGLSAPAEWLSRLLDVVVDVAAAPSFPAAEFERIRRREVAGLRHDLDEPGLVADRAMIAAAYGDHPYGHPVEGRARHLARVRRSDALDFHRRWFGPSAATLVVVGTVQPARALRLARRWLGGWARIPEPPPPVPPAPRATPSVLLVDRPEATQTHLRIAAPALPRHTPEYFPAVVANSILGGGFTSRLVEAIRVSRGLSYGVRSRFAMARASGLWIFSSFTKPESAGELVQVAREEIRRFCDEGPTAEELARAQAYLSGLFPLSLETHEQLADRLGDVELLGYPIEEVTGYRERVRAVTAEACRQVARRWLPHSGGVLVAVGPAKRVRRQLEPFGPVTVVPAGRVM